MELLHMMGHNANWNLDLHFKNEVGSGFVFCAYSFPIDYFSRKKGSGYNMDRILPKSILDFQFYGKKESSNLTAGNFGSYSFHPANVEDDDLTSVYIFNCIEEAVEYQESLGLDKIIIPNYYENNKLEQLIGIIKQVNRWLGGRRKLGHEYYMTIPITNHMVIDETKMESLLYALTDMSICFDGFYITCEAKPETRRKISTEMKYLINLSRFLTVLKKQQFKIIYAYANWDALLFFAQVDIDYISIETFENLRNFSIKRFIDVIDGGPSDGWYFSEKLLNFVKAQYIELLRNKGALNLIANTNNIFSDEILNTSYAWNNMKPDVHKNYIVAVSSMFDYLSNFAAGQERKSMLLEMVENSMNTYESLKNRGIKLLDESSNYHLDTWRIFLENV
jgi:regulator of sigma D